MVERSHPWCQCGRNENGVGYKYFTVGKFVIPGRESKVCWDCMLEYVCSISWKKCDCLCHGQPFDKKEVLRICEHCDGQVEKELKRLNDLKKFAPFMSSKPFDTEAWRSKKIIYKKDEEEQR